MSTAISDNLIRKLDELDAHNAELARQLEDPAVLADHRKVRELSIRRSAQRELVDGYRQWRALQEQIAELREVISADEDAELMALANEELPGIESQAARLMEQIQNRLVTAEDRAVGSIILEVRAGVGGDEAAIWAGDVVQMYRRFAGLKGWSSEDMQFTPGDAGGCRMAMLRLAGEAVWSHLGYEGGTHQVKRIPATEAQGRIHTSTATVAVLPEPEEIEVRIETDDVREIVTTAQGPGGQNVNKVATAVHLIHEATGIEVRMQDTKSQAQNREKAWRILRARLFERQKAEAQAQRAEARAAMIGSGDRAEKIRTYRYKENVVVDHRLGGEAGGFNLDRVMTGDLQPIVDALVQQDTAQRLAAL